MVVYEDGTVAVYGPHIKRRSPLHDLPDVKADLLAAMGKAGWEFEDAAKAIEGAFDEPPWQEGEERAKKLRERREAAVAIVKEHRSQLQPPLFLLSLNSTPSSNHCAHSGSRFPLLRFPIRSRVCLWLRAGDTSHRYFHNHLSLYVQ